MTSLDTGLGLDSVPESKQWLQQVISGVGRAAVQPCHNQPLRFQEMSWGLIKSHRAASQNHITSSAYNSHILHVCSVPDIIYQTICQPISSKHSTRAAVHTANSLQPTAWAAAGITINHKDQSRPAWTTTVALQVIQHLV